MLKRFQRGARVALPRFVKAFPVVKTARQTRGDLRILRVEHGDLLGQKGVSMAVCGVKMPMIATKSAQQRIHLVRISQIKRRMARQCFDPRQSTRQARRRLNRQPFIDDQGFVLPTLIEGRQRLISDIARRIGAPKAVRAVAGVPRGRVKAGAVVAWEEAEALFMDVTCQRVVKVVGGLGLPKKGAFLMNSLSACQ